MALSKGTNSYLEVSEADAYFQGRLDADEWLTGNNDKKESALITATMLLDELSYVSKPLSITQALAFPREGTYFDSFYQANFPLSEIPRQIVKALCEQALHLLKNPDLLSPADTFEQVEVASISIKRIRKPSRYPNLVLSALKDLLRESPYAGNLWFRSN